jgi:hypothetical protein
MTYNDAMTLVKSELDDAGIFFDDADIDYSITDGYDLVALFSGCIERVASLPFVASQVYYDIPASVGDYFRAFAVFDQNSKLWLDPIPLKKLEMLDDRWEVQTGTPAFFCPLSFDTIALYPHYASAPASNFLLYYKALPPNDVSTFALPKSSEQVLIDFAKSDLFDQALEFGKSQRCWKDFQTNLLRCRRLIEDIPLRDRIAQMTARIYGSLD